MIPPAPLHSEPRISVVMPVFNGTQYICEAIDSILRQSFQDFELIVINDGSTDNSVEKVLSFHDPRIRLINRTENLGLTATRNEGVAASFGDYIAMLDCDDIAMPNRLELQLKYLMQHPECALVGSWIIEIDQEGREVEQHRLASGALEIPVNLLFHNVFAQSSVMMRKSLLPEGPYREGFPPSEDYDLWSRIARKHAVANLPIPLIKYRVHPGGISSKKAAEAEKSVRKIITEQLEYLGLRVTDVDVDIHRCLGRNEGASTMEDFVSVAHWLERVSSANKKSQIYSQEVLDKFIEFKWRKYCQASKNIGLIECVNIYRNSKIASSNEFMLKNIASIIYHRLIR